MVRLLHPLVMLVAQATDSELAKMIEYLKAENRILRGKLPKRVYVTRTERRELVALGKRLGSAVKELITIVTYRSFLRWLNDQSTGRKPKPKGRPRKPEEVRDLVLKFAQETNWGHRRIHGELKKLGIGDISASTVARILKSHGVEPGPKRGQGSWSDFIDRHRETLWACDFFSNTVWTLRGPRKYVVLFFIHIGTRRLHVAGLTRSADSMWMAEQAKALVKFFDDQGDYRPTHIIRDRDGKFTTDFCSTMETAGIKLRQTSRRAPDMNPYAETLVQSIRRECLNHFAVFGERHFAYLLTEYETYFNTERPHQGRNNEIPLGPEPPPAVSPDDLTKSEIVCHQRLGGLLKSYVRRAA